MPERLRADKKQKIDPAHAELVAALQERGLALSEAETQRLHEKLAAFSGKTNPERIDIPTLGDAIAEKINASPEARDRWFQKAGLRHTLQEHARGNIERAAELRRSIAERTDWTPVPAEASTADGRYYLAQLMSEAHLKQESAFLEHCLGTGSLDYYLPRIKRREIEIFSVRDSQTHEPIVTIEYDVRSKCILQVKGRNNQLLTAESPYVKPTAELIAFLRNGSMHHDRFDPQTGASMRREVRAVADLDQLVRENSLLLATGEIVDIETAGSTALTAADVLTGNLSIGSTMLADVIARITALPVNVDARAARPSQISLLQTVGGDLDLSGTKITKLPDNLRVGGDLDLSSTNITSLPDNLTVAGSLNLAHTNITALPDNLRVGGNLDLSDTKITELPENLKVGGTLDLTDSSITSLPDNLTVAGSLDLSDTKITELPENLKVGGTLHLSDTNIATLPDNLSVGGSLYLRRTKIRKLGENLKVGGNLDLSETDITQLPENLEVGGTLDLSDSNITALPQNFRVGGDLLLTGTNITKLPDNLTVGGSLNLYGTNIATLPDNLSVGGSLYLRRTEITKLGENLKVGGNLYLSDSKITALPDNLSVGGDLNLYGTNIATLPANLSVGGDLYLSSTSIETIPPTLRSKIKGRVIGP